MTRSIEETKALFNAWAKSYDKDVENAVGILEGYETSLEIASEMCEVSKDSAVLDIGIGTGKFAQSLEKQGAQISGIDLSDSMIRTCKELHPSYDLQIGTFQHIPYADESFDTVISSFCFHEVQKEERSLASREVYRVCKSGGYLCLLDIVFSSQAALAEGRALAGTHWDDSEEYSLVGDLSGYLYDAGFHSVRWVQTGRFHWMCLACKGERCDEGHRSD